MSFAQAGTLSYTLGDTDLVEDMSVTIAGPTCPVAYTFSCPLGSCNFVNFDAATAALTVTTRDPYVTGDVGDHSYTIEATNTDDPTITATLAITLTVAGCVTNPGSGASHSKTYTVGGGPVVFDVPALTTNPSSCPIVEAYSFVESDGVTPYADAVYQSSDSTYIYWTFDTSDDATPDDPSLIGTTINFKLITTAEGMTDLVDDITIDFVTCTFSFAQQGAYTWVLGGPDLEIDFAATIVDGPCPINYYLSMTDPSAA